ncbi:hypothetical protein ACIP79_41250 [Streptomyces sp. NPDC088747]|uniref:hypothetical protein n=1 Tax=Streptomyces sp. NPDC088747 TaxID=3365886 RepID=UPI0037FA647C
MSQPTPPSQPTEGNPYAGQQPAPGSPYAGQQQPGTGGGNPFAGQPQAGAGGGNPFAGGQPGFVAPAPPRQGNVALGIVAAVVAALVTAGIYGAIIGASEYEIGYAAIGVGFLVGLAAGKIGGSNPVLPVVSAVLALGAVYVGQIIGIVMIGSDKSGISATTLLTDHFDLVTASWKESADFMSFVFFGVGAFAAFSAAKKAGA